MREYFDKMEALRIMRAGTDQARAGDMEKVAVWPLAIPIVKGLGWGAAAGAGVGLAARGGGKVYDNIKKDKPALDNVGKAAVGLPDNAKLNWGNVGRAAKTVGVDGTFGAALGPSGALVRHGARSVAPHIAKRLPQTGVAGGVVDKGRQLSSKVKSVVAPGQAGRGKEFAKGVARLGGRTGAAVPFAVPAAGAYNAVMNPGGSLKDWMPGVGQTLLTAVGGAGIRGPVAPKGGAVPPTARPTQKPARPRKSVQMVPKAAPARAPSRRHVSLSLPQPRGTIPGHSQPRPMARDTAISPPPIPQRATPRPARAAPSPLPQQRATLSSSNWRSSSHGAAPKPRPAAGPIPPQRRGRWESLKAGVKSVPGELRSTARNFGVHVPHGYNETQKNIMDPTKGSNPISGYRQRQATPAQRARHSMMRDQDASLRRQGPPKVTTSNLNLRRQKPTGYHGKTPDPRPKNQRRR